VSIDDQSSSSETATVACRNYGQQVLAASVQFLAGQGKPAHRATGRTCCHRSCARCSKPNPPSAASPGWCRRSVGRDSRQKAPPATTLQIPVPPKAVAVRYLCGGLGRGTYDPHVCPIGIAPSILAEYILRTACLVAGMSSPPTSLFTNFFSDPAQFLKVLPAFAFLAQGKVAQAITGAGNVLPGLDAMLDSLGSIVFSTPLSDYLDNRIASNIAADAIIDTRPAFQVAGTLLQRSSVVSAIDGVLSNAFVIENDVQRAATMITTLKPADWAGTFPAEAAAYAATLELSDGGTSVTFSGAADAVNGGVIARSLDGLPSGGDVRLRTTLSTEDGAVVAEGVSRWIGASAAAGQTNIVVNLEPDDRPLRDGIIYTHHQKKLPYDNQAQVHVWAASAPPVETRTWQSPVPKHWILRLVNITVGQAPAMVAYAWEATGLNQPKDQPNGPISNDPMFTVQNAAIFGSPQGPTRSRQWASASRLAYDTS
jgi:hypothetical protein